MLENLMIALAIPLGFAIPIGIGCFVVLLLGSIEDLYYKYKWTIKKRILSVLHGK